MEAKDPDGELAAGVPSYANWRDPEGTDDAGVDTAAQA